MESIPDPPQPRTTLSQAFAAGAWRGAKFGAAAAAALTAPMFVFGWFLVLRSPEKRAREFSSGLDIAKAIGGTIGGLAVAACWGALVGSVLMAAAALVRRRRNST